MAKSNQQKQRDRRARLKKSGLKRVEIWVPDEPKCIEEAKALDRSRGLFHEKTIDKNR